MFVGLDEGIQRTFDDGLRHRLAVDQRLVGPPLLGLVANIRLPGHGGDVEQGFSKTGRSAGKNWTRKRSAA